MAPFLKAHTRFLCAVSPVNFSVIVLLIIRRAQVRILPPHGMHLKDGVATSPSETKLYCNLIISYISFLLPEYEKLKT